MNRQSDLLWSLVFCAAITSSASVWADISLVGQGSIPGDAIDQSGLTGLLEDGVTPRNQAGGFGSAIAYTGVGDFYIATPDRGPSDDTTTYIDRIYTLDIGIKPSGPDSFILLPEIVRTRLMHTQEGKYLTGSAAAFDPTNSAAGLRFDPEGARVGRCGHSLFVSDEYGPFIYEFNSRSGKRLRVLDIPTKYLIDFPSADPGTELANNLAGRQASRGMEGLAISPDGGKLYGIMQSPLLQDGALDDTGTRIGTNNRIVELDLASGSVREFLYPLDDRANGVSEILAINNHEFLTLERDSEAGNKAKFKRLFKIDISNATDIRALKQLPSTDIPQDVIPVAKQLFLDFLDPRFGLAGEGFPEKLEGLTFGPRLPDGRDLLIVTSDNDFRRDQSSRFFAFAIDPQDLPGLELQMFHTAGDEDCPASM